MPLSLQNQTVGDVAVIVCSGRIVEGDEAAALEHRVRELQLLHRDFVLDLHGVAFVDSAGLGLLVRLLARLRSAGGDLELCNVSSNIQKSLQISRLNTVLASHESIEAAIAALYQWHDESSAPERAAVDVLCVHPSHDVLAYLRELLRQAGYGVMATGNTSDAATLLRAMNPKMVVIDAEMRRRATSVGFGQLLGNVNVIELSPAFATEDGGDAGTHLLQEVVRVWSPPANRRPLL